MIALTQITNTEILVFIAVQVLSYWTLTFCLEIEKTVETAKNRLLFKKVANFTGKLLQNYKTASQ